jgi:hypothetical protein
MAGLLAAKTFYADHMGLIHGTVQAELLPQQIATSEKPSKRSKLD